jgi:hypothetical protein
MTATSIAHLHTPPHKKSAFVDLGLYALGRGDWAIVAAITRLTRERGWSHA